MKEVPHDLVPLKGDPGNRVGMSEGDKPQSDHYQHTRDQTRQTTIKIPENWQMLSITGRP